MSCENADIGTPEEVPCTVKIVCLIQERQDIFISTLLLKMWLACYQGSTEYQRLHSPLRVKPSYEVRVIFSLISPNAGLDRIYVGLESIEL